MTTTLSGNELSPRFADILIHLERGEDVLVADQGRTIARITSLLPELKGTMNETDAIAAANARVLRHIVPGRAPGGIDEAGIERDLAAAYGNPS